MGERVRRTFFHIIMVGQVVLAFAVILLISLIGPAFTGAPWVPTPLQTVRRMLRLAGVRPGEKVYDLGSGDGRVLIIAAREFGAQAVGIEIDPLRYLWTRVLVALLGLGDRVSVRRANFFDVNLSDADVVTLYLVQRTNERLMPKLWRELRPGARIVSHAFTFPGWQPIVQDGEVRVYRQESEK